MSTEFNATSAFRALQGGVSAAPKVSPIRAAAFDDVREAVGKRLSQGTPGAMAAVADAFAIAERLWGEIRTTPAFVLGAKPAGCKKGCGWCCHQRVGATAVEVLYIAGQLRARPEAAPLLARLDAWDSGRPCVFLVDDACAIYDLRPLKCRGLYQMDARWCMTTYAKLDPPLFGPPLSHDYQTQPKDVFDGAVFGLAQPFYAAGHDCPGVDFIPALKAVIHRPEAVEEWWRGKEVFPAATRLHDWFPPMEKGKGKKKRG
ncbi:conserved hypothetical protein [Candidatus Terasakiella magnetica]|nr:conserved hypothetical protein [Candidatus Terasakiella magnetica]